MIDELINQQREQIANLESQVEFLKSQLTQCLELVPEHLYDDAFASVKIALHMTASQCAKATNLGEN